MIYLPYIVVMAIFNRMRGSHLYELTNSTEISRLVAMGGMAVATGALFHSVAAILWSWGFLMLWCTSAWDRYWEAATGGPVGSPQGFAPVDWIMKSWPMPPGGWKLRLWGTIAMCLRQMLIIPFFAGLCYLTDGNYYIILLSPLLGIWYLLAGLTVPREYSVLVAEYLVGGSIGLLCLML